MALKGCPRSKRNNGSFVGPAYLDDFSDFLGGIREDHRIRRLVLDPRGCVSMLLAGAQPRMDAIGEFLPEDGDRRLMAPRSLRAWCLFPDLSHLSFTNKSLLTYRPRQ